MTLLSIVQSVCDQLSFAKPSTVINNTSDENAVQMLALANRGGKELARRGTGRQGWTILTKEHTFTTVASTEEYALPSDFAWLIDDTLWDRTNFWQLRGPMSPQQWQVFKSGIVSLGARDRVRIKPSASSNVKALFVDPVPGSAETKVFEYMSDQWCQSSGGTGQTAWAADTDTGILDEAYLELDLIWRFKKAKELDWNDDFRFFEMEIAQAMARDNGMPTVSMSGVQDTRLITTDNIQDVDFPT